MNQSERLGRGHHEEVGDQKKGAHEDEVGAQQ